MISSGILPLLSPRILTFAFYGPRFFSRATSSGSFKNVLIVCKATGYEYEKSTYPENQNLSFEEHVR